MFLDTPFPFMRNNELRRGGLRDIVWRSFEDPNRRGHGLELCQPHFNKFTKLWTVFDPVDNTVKYTDLPLLELAEHSLTTDAPLLEIDWERRLKTLKDGHPYFTQGRWNHYTLKWDKFQKALVPSPCLHRTAFSTSAQTRRRRRAGGAEDG